MKLMLVHKLLPVRNETGAIYKWEDSLLLLSPMQVESVAHVEEIKHTVVNLQSGKQLIVEETCEEFMKKFNGATE